MLQTHHSTAPHGNQSNPFISIKSVNRSKAISKGAKILYATLRLSAGNAGRIKFRIHRLADETASSISSTKEYLQELKAAGLVIGEQRPGRANLWHVFDPEADEPRAGQGGQPTHRPDPADPPAPLLKDVPEKTLERTVEPSQIREVDTKSEEPATQRNVLSPRDKKKPDPFDTELLREIIQLSGDTKSRRFWIGVVNRIPEEEIRIGLDALRTAMNDGIILAKPGAYLHSVLKNRNPQAFGAPTATPRPQAAPSEPPAPKIPDRAPEPITEPAPHEIAMAALAKIRAILHRPSEIQ